MKIAVVYATAGAGHKKAAVCIADFIRSQGPRHTVTCEDIVGRSSWFFKLIYLWGYDFLVNHCQWLWAFLFYLTARPALRHCSPSLSTLVHYYNTLPFCDHLVKDQPDIVISTHFLSSDIVSYLKAKRRLHCTLITVITDFGVHPFWLNANTDMYCVASENTKNILNGLGVGMERIRVTGIPTDPKFSRPHDRSAICTRLGIDGTRKIVLVVTGSFGIGPIEGIVRALHEEYTVLAVCARNERLYSRLNAAQYSNTHVFGFIDFIDDLMAIADVIITKPGGLTISELLCMNCIPIFIASIPGQESVNVSVLEAAGIGKGISHIRDIQRQVAARIVDAQRISGIIQSFKQQNSVARIYDIIRTDRSGITS